MKPILIEKYNGFAICGQFAHVEFQYEIQDSTSAINMPPARSATFQIIMPLEQLQIFAVASSKLYLQKVNGGGLDSTVKAHTLGKALLIPEQRY